MEKYAGLSKYSEKCYNFTLLGKRAEIARVDPGMHELVNTFLQKDQSNTFKILCYVKPPPGN